MRLVVSLLTCLGLGGLTQALATDSPTPPRPATQDQQTSAPADQSKAATTTAPPSTNAAASSTSAAPSATSAAAAPASQPQPAAATSAAAKNPKTPELTPGEKHLLASGYRLEMRGGEKHFCRSEASLGTRFSKKVCVTAEQAAITEHNAQEATRDSQRVFDYNAAH